MKQGLIWKPLMSHYVQCLLKLVISFFSYDFFLLFALYAEEVILPSPVILFHNSRESFGLALLLTGGFCLLTSTWGKTV